MRDVLDQGFAMIDFVRMQGITKVFSGRVANDNIDFNLERGEIHGILGENGAGKTTLMNILTGLYQPQKGEIFFKGIRTKIDSPQDAMRLGIAMVHQSPMLIPSMTGRENIILAAGFKGILWKKGKIEQKIRAIMHRYRLNMDLDVKISELSVGEIQRVELLKALMREPELLIFDEATSTLTDKETEEFFDILRTLNAAACTIVFISHKLHELMAISHRITVLHDGKIAGLYQTAEVSKEELATVMMGARKPSNIDQSCQRPSIPKSSRLEKPLLELNGITASLYPGGCGLENITFLMYPGEILGIAGIDGNGQRELAEIVAGVSRASKGSITIQGKKIKKPRPRKMIDVGVSYIPQDRYQSGAIGDFNLEENMILPIHNKYPLSSFGFLCRNSIRGFAKQSLEDFQIKASQATFPAKALSGGNLQRLILARELARDPLIIVACYPTRGLDLAARDYLWLRFRQEREKGKGILLISADLEEILALSDRVGVLYGGKLLGPIPVEEASSEKLGLYMSGG